APAPATPVSFDAVLPVVPSDESWIMALKAGGVLKIDQSSVLSAVRAALASRVRLYEIPDILLDRMERFADENEEQVTAEFYEMRDLVTRRSYAEIFASIKGMDGRFVTETRKKQLLQRLDEALWPSLSGFQAALKGWQDAWMQGSANPAILMSAIASAVAVSGGAGGMMPPGMMAPPDTSTLRDAAEGVNNAINRAFRGTGVQIAAALAYDATKIREVITNPRLPALIGAPNRDQMLKMLGVAVSPTYPRLEQNLARYVLAIIQVKDVPSGKEEVQYFGYLYMLGMQIPWDEINGLAGRSNGKSVTGIGGRRVHDQFGSNSHD
ncbi:MAG TPA: hypothetical protein VFQ60_01480, partial [Patescibacteria group bacterium]|nr:hypothetical protein [Patescibacteria group bacterium]